MFDRDSWHEIWVALSRNRMRTLLTAFGVFWGIFMLILLLGSGTGLHNGVVQGFSDSATNSFFLWGQRTTEPYRGLSVGRDVDMTVADADAIRREIAEADVVAPRVSLAGHRGETRVVHEGKSGAFQVMGDYPEIRRLSSVKMQQGRFLNPLDIEERRKVAVIGERVAAALFEPGEPVLDNLISVNGVYFRVVGVFTTLAQGDRGQEDLETVYVPFTTFQQAFNYGNRVDWFAITADAGVPASVVEERVLALLKDRHDVAPTDERAFGHFNLEEEFNQVQNLFLGIRLLVWIVGTGTLAAGVIGVSNIMLIIVRERTREIGMRRAVGATPWSITSQILLESTVLTGVAGYVGLLAGVGIIEIIRGALQRTPDGGAEMMFVNPGVAFENALLALGVLVVCGVLAGLLPARRALAISPTAALRAE